MNSDATAKVILPGATIGILGGGQLGRMMATRGREMGYRFICLDPKPDSSCGQVCDRQVVAEYDDVEAARELAKFSDVVTYEFENVSPGVTALLEEECYVPQGSELLRITRHRRHEKEAVRSAGAVVAPYVSVTDEDSFYAALEEIGAPSVLKTVTGGYDGKGQAVIRAVEDGPEAFAGLSDRGELVLEKFIDFERELSVVVARSTNGEVRTFPVSENVHVDNILHLSIVPARISEEIEEGAARLARKIASALDVVGVLAVEMFLTAGGDLYVNELAPRPHNSGHYTIDACLTSQFEQHLRAICGLPLGNPRRHTPVVMANLLGQHVEPWLKRYAKEPEAEVEVKTHLYGKAQARRGRKMGHVNVLADSVEVALSWINEAGIWQEMPSNGAEI